MEPVELPFSINSADFDAKIKSIVDSILKTGDAANGTTADVKDLGVALGKTPTIKIDATAIAKVRDELDDLSTTAPELAAAIREYFTVLGNLATGVVGDFKSAGAAATATEQAVAKIPAATKKAAAATKELADSMDKTSKATKKVEETKFDPLNFQVQQLVREVPSLQFGFNTFIAAIGNNLPMLADEIKRAGDNAKTMAKNGKESVPVWKSIGSALLSWQTGLVVALTLMPEILEWINKIAKGGDYTAKNFAKMKEYIQGVADNAAEPVTEIQLLSLAWTSLGNDMAAKRQFITDNADAFDQLKVSISDTTDAENLFVAHKTEFVNAMLDRARALAAEKLAQEQITKAVKELQTVQGKEPDRYIQQAGSYSASITGGGSTPYYQTFNEVPKEIIEKFGDVKNAISQGALIINPAFERWEDNVGKAQVKVQKAGVDLMTMATNFSTQSSTMLKSLGQSGDKLTSGSIDAIRAKIAALQKQYEATGDAVKRNDLAAQIKQQQAILKQMDTLSVKPKDTTRQQQRIDNDMLQLQQDTTAKYVDLLKDDGQFKLAQIEANYDKQMELVDRKEAEWRKAQNGSLTPDQTTTLTASRAAITDTRTAEEDKVNREIQEKSDKAHNDYLIKYGSYQEQIVALTAEYAKKIADASNADDQKSLAVERDVKISQVKAQASKQTALWQKYFGDLGKMSKTSIDQLLAQMELVISYGKGEIKELPDDLEQAFGSINDGSKASEQELKQFEQRAKSVKQVIKQMDSDNPFAKIKDAIKEMSEAESGSVQQTEGLHNLLGGLSDANGAISTLTGLFSSFGGKAAKALQDVGNVIDKTLSGAQAGAALGGEYGAIAGAVLGAGSGIADIYAKSVELSDEAVHAYNSQLQALDDLIGKQKEYLDTVAAGSDAFKEAENQTKEYYETQLRLSANQAIDYEGSGAGAFSHSHGYTNNKALNDYYDGLKKSVSQNNQAIASEMDEWLDKWNIPSFKNITGQIVDLSDVFSLGTEDMVGALTELKSMDNATFFSKLDEQTQDYINSILKANDALNEFNDTTKADLTGQTYDELQSSLDALVTDTDLTFDKIGQSFEDTMSKAILNVVKKGAMQKALTNWYNDFAAAMEDGKLSADEADSLRQQYQQAVKDANDQYIAAMSVIGADSGGSASSSQTAQSGLFETMTQDQASALQGQFDAIRIGVIDIRGDVKSIADFTQSFRLDATVMVNAITAIEKNTADTASAAQSLLQISRAIQTEGLKIK
jgi:hypothetical protein